MLPKTLVHASPYLACGSPLSDGQRFLEYYQVTGPVLKVRPDMVAVQKGQERSEIGRDSSTQVSGDLKVSARVTIQYRMTAASIEIKPAKGK